ncbi:unnamed protein product [Brachionus calyciflorus]|uniref:Uncharacterized protein n=1 Tax=Brachionus calyciflorus TaxID=104777 RepID=A0A813M579_9BILA|nr:unnamed protein product [Brachionus calyciflorus]
MFRIFLRKYSINTHELSRIKDKLNKLPIKINTNLLDVNTLNRLGVCSNDYLENLVQNLSLYGIRDKYLCDTLRVYEDWGDLTKEKIEYVWCLFRELSLSNDIYASSLSRNPSIIEIDKKFLQVRLDEFKEFFTKKNLDRLLVRTPELLTGNFDLFRYKFTYCFALMGIEQDEMSSSNYFSHQIEHIRARHLFLNRSGFFDSPYKKGHSKLINSKLSHIVDTNLKEYLRLCTNNLFEVDDFNVFCDYLKKENFDNELLGLRIGKLLRNQILDSIKYQKKLDQDEFD